MIKERITSDSLQTLHPKCPLMLLQGFHNFCIYKTQASTVQYHKCYDKNELFIQFQGNYILCVHPCLTNLQDLVLYGNTLLLCILYTLRGSQDAYYLSGEAK